MLNLAKVTKHIIPIRNERFLLAVSGGLDSMALVHIFLHWREHFGIHFDVAHFHHGPSIGAHQQTFRFDAYQLVRDFCLQNQIRFHCNYGGEDVETFLAQWDQPAGSEAEYRDQRYYYLYGLMVEKGFDRLVLAHHRDDLLETRLMRMIRGVGPDGLQSMTEFHNTLLRPLLRFSRSELQAFVVGRQGRWIEDPSNQDLAGFRNWMRKKWLTELEEKSPGAKKSLARSLDLLVEIQQSQPTFGSCFCEETLILSEWLCLSTENKRLVLARYMKSQGLKNYGLSHINEVIKRLDTEKKSHTFNLLGCRWQVDAGRMSVIPPTGIERLKTQC